MSNRSLLCRRIAAGLPGRAHTLPIRFDSFANRILVRTVHDRLASLVRTGAQPFDPAGFEPFYPTVDAPDGHFRLFPDPCGTQTFRFEQYAAATHPETMALPLRKPNLSLFRSDSVNASILILIRFYILYAANIRQFYYM
jgi:hypothetical protein